MADGEPVAILVLVKEHLPAVPTYSDVELRSWPPARGGVCHSIRRRSATFGGGLPAPCGTSGFRDRCRRRCAAHSNVRGGITGDTIASVSSVGQASSAAWAVVGSVAYGDVSVVSEACNRSGVSKYCEVASDITADFS